MAHRLRPQAGRDYMPVSWQNYFDEAHDICPDQDDPGKELDKQDVFRVYLRNFKPPFAPARKLGSRILNLEQLETSECDRKTHSQTTTIVTLHGGGYSGLTWAQFTHFVEKECNCRILSMDLRGHGDTKTCDDDRMDMDTLVEDVAKVVHETHRICGFSETPRIVLVGHSMGGAIAVKLSSRCTDLMASLAGFVIIDVVEGTAKEALPLMLSVIETRPRKFPTLANAIEWSFRSGMAKNIEAARVSMPGNLLNIESGYLGIHDIKSSKIDTEEGASNKIIRHKFHIDSDRLMSPMGSSPPSLSESTMPKCPRVTALRHSLPGSQFPRPSLDESAESSAKLTSLDHDCGAAPAPGDQESPSATSDSFKRPQEVDQTGYCWRTNLAKTQPFWNGWFDGLSQQLLDAPVQGKFLLLAGIDRLDRTLTIGQMQGKFMMKVLPKCGHAVHEDLPNQVASVVGQFLVRNKFATATTVESDSK